MRTFKTAGVAIGLMLITSACEQNRHLTVRGTDDIFAAGLAQAQIPGDMGTTPLSTPVQGGATLTISAKGVVTCCGASGSTSGPAGFAKNPLGDGSNITNSLPTPVGAFEDPQGAFALVVVFGGAGGPKGAPIKVGDHAVLTAPSWADRVYFGFPDADAFNGGSGAYSDNGGSVSVEVREQK